jgi:signal transduction histidine kinase
MHRHLAVAFAGIALLTAVLLATGLLVMLDRYYARAEKVFLRGAASRVLDSPVPPLTGTGLRDWTIESALAANSRVRIYTADGKLLSDSGPWSQLKPGMIGSETGTPSPPATPSAASTSLPQPLGNGLFGDSGSSEVSDASLTIPLPASAGVPGGYAILSGPPVSGRAVLVGVAEGSLVAGVIAVILAAITGYYLAKRMSQPIVGLKAATDRMARGDLAVRADATSSNEVGELAESFNVMAERTEATVSTLRRFVGDAAHEIGTPLTALQTDLQLAERVAATPDERRLVARAFAQARRLRDLCEGLLSLSRIEAGGTTSAGRCDLVASARSAVDAVASRAEQADVKLTAVTPAEEVLVASDASRVDAIVMNLLDNAVKFTPPHGQVVVTVASDAGHAMLAVSDTGPGIPLDEREAVFARFHRGANSAGVPGSGLGLAIVQAAVGGMNGTVELSSGELGTRFEVVVPLAPSLDG